MGIRAHLFKILYRYLEEQTDLRTLLAHPKKMQTLQSARELVYELERRYQDVMDIEYQKGDQEVDRNKKVLVDMKSSNPNSSWYRRHRDAIASNKMKIRGAKDVDNSSMTAEEKKKAIL